MKSGQRIENGSIWVPVPSTASNSLQIRCLVSEFMCYAFTDIWHQHRAKLVLRQRMKIFLVIAPKPGGRIVIGPMPCADVIGDVPGRTNIFQQWLFGAYDGRVCSPAIKVIRPAVRYGSRLTQIKYKADLALSRPCCQRQRTEPFTTAAAYMPRTVPPMGVVSRTPRWPPARPRRRSAGR